MEIIANALQTVQPNQDVVFTDTVISGNASMIHRLGSGQVNLRGLTCNQCRARFRVTFGGNIGVPAGGTAGQLYMALAIDGEPIASTTMASVPAAVGDYNNIASSIFIEIPKGCCGRVSVRNTSTVPIEIGNANLIVERVA